MPKHMSAFDRNKVLDVVREMMSSGFKSQEIATRVGISVSTLGYWKKKGWIPPKGGKPVSKNKVTPDGKVIRLEPNDERFQLSFESLLSDLRTAYSGGSELDLIVRIGKRHKLLKMWQSAINREIDRIETIGLQIAELWEEMSSTTA